MHAPLSILPAPGRPRGPFPGFALAFALVWSLGLGLGGCSWFSWHPGDEAGDPGLTTSDMPVFVGDAFTVTVNGHLGRCQSTWSVEPVPSAEAGHFTWSDRHAQLIGTRAGQYTVSFQCGSLTLKKSVEILGEVTVQAVDRVPLAQLCYDSVFTQSGRLLCVNQGVSVLDPKSGALLGHTDALSPLAWGIATQGELFATASIGCEKCGPSDSDISPGAMLYRLGGPGGSTPELLATLTVEQAQELAFSGQNLFVTLNDKVLRFDISDPQHPRQSGCIAVSLGDAPALVQGSRLLTLSESAVSAFDLSDFDQCPKAAMPSSELPFGLPSSPITPTQWASKGELLYVALGRRFIAVDLQQPAALTQVFSSEPTRSTGLPAMAIDTTRPDGKLFVMQNKRVVVYDLANPAAPRPIAAWAPSQPLMVRFGVANGRFMAVNNAELWSLTVN